ncbi:MAG: choice-of-anchor L domain-containing protein [Chitinophagaceae bacterium]
MKNAFLSLLFLIIYGSSTAQLQITGNNVATQLAQVLVGYGVTTSNETLNCGEAATGEYGSGTFSVTSSNLGLDSGIILTSGRAASTTSNNGANVITGTNVTPSSVTGNGADLDLNQAVNGTTFDKCVLEFDFVTIGDTVKFDYIFASSEYPSFTCSSFNDVFGFFLSGPGIVGPYSNSSKNIALVPGSTTCPVGVSTIYCPNNPGCCNTTNTNCFGLTPGCSAFNATNNTCSYFVCNANGTTVNYKGFTTVLTAISEVIPCSTYHIKLAIADKSDQVLDSGVFLKAGSFSSNVIDVKLNTGLTTIGGDPILVEGCDTAKLHVTRKIVLGTPYADTINVQYQGNSVNGIDYTTLPTQIIFGASLTDTIKEINLYAIDDGLLEGTEYLKIYILSGCSQLITDSLIIEIKDSLSFALFNSDTAICLGNSVTLDGVQDNGINILWTPATDVLDPNTLNTVITPSNYGTQLYTATGSFGSCAPVTRNVTITTDPVPIIQPISDAELCEGETADIQAIVSPPFNYNISWNPSSGLINANGYNPTFVGTSSQDIVFTVTSPNALCADTTQFHMQVWPFAVGTIKEDTLVCDGDPVQLWVSGGNNLYQWYPALNLSCEFCPNPIATGLGTTTYYAILLDSHGCQDTLDVTIENHPPFNLVLHNNDTTIYLGESVQMYASGAPYYYWTPTEYLGFSQSNDPVATPLHDITYYVTGVSQLQGCPQMDSVKIRVITQDVFVPNAFSPNGDGKNDEFRITARNLINVQEFRIFNRWGQELFYTNDIRKGWDGRYKGKLQDNGVYYYMIRVSYPWGKTEFLKGDLTLIK